MEKKKIDLPLILLPIFAISSILFALTNINTINLPRNFNRNKNIKVEDTPTEMPIIEDIVFFKTVDEHLVYLRKKVNEENGIFSVFVKDIKTDEEYTVNSNELFYGASLYKFPVAVATLKQVEEKKISLEDVLIYTSRDYSPGTGSISKTSYGTRYTVSETLDYLMRHSDNSGQLMLERAITEEYLMGVFSDLALYSLTNDFYHKNITSPKEVAYIIENIFCTDYLSDVNKRFLTNLMYPTLFDNRITPYLNKGLIFYHKIGSWPYSWHDCGIVHGDDKEVIVCLMSKDTNYSNFLSVAKYVGGFVNGLF